MNDLIKLSHKAFGESVQDKPKFYYVNSSSENIFLSNDEDLTKAIANLSSSWLRVYIKSPNTNEWSLDRTNSDVENKRTGPSTDKTNIQYFSIYS